MSKLNFFATCPKGLERLLFEELSALNLINVRETVAGVSFEGEFNDGLKACLWSRFASRILLELSEFEAPSDLELYLGVMGIAWEKYFSPYETIAVEFNGMTDEIRNTQYGALKVKDAVCDRLLKSAGARPNVDRDNPDVRIYCHLERRGRATVALDLSGKALLKREYSRHTGLAPLKENLAAAMVVRSGYKGGCMFDPMCGSGTLLIEAASLATDTAPGLKRRSYGFFKLKQFDADFWKALLQEASERSKQGFARCLEQKVQIIGFDRDAQMVEFCNENLKKAGFDSIAHAEVGDAQNLHNPFDESSQITIVTNPPYGKRMGNFNELIALYTALGEGIKRCFKGARAAVISSSAELLSCLRLHADRVYRLFNGALECQLRVFDIESSGDTSAKEERNAKIAEDFANRLKKNLAYMRKWAKNTQTDAYRIYDADVPEYQAAVDCYGDYYVIQAYSPKDKVNERVHKRRVLDMISATVAVTGAEGSHVILKSREIQHGDAQYEKAQEQKNNFMEVNEGPFKFRVNLEDYLDTGLFLDARIIREKIAKCAQGKRFLNLFCYTGSATVAACKGGAISSLSVDMSRTYLEWARENLELNGIKLKDHRMLQADVLSWIAQEHNEKFDLIYVDPPTFSNSKRMKGSFDVKRDQVALLSSLTRFFDEEGTVIFCNNCRNFKLDESLTEYGFKCEDISKATLPRDFKRNEKIHSCFMLTFKRSYMQKEPLKLEAAPAPKWQREINTDHREHTSSTASNNNVYGKRRTFAQQDRSFARKDRFNERNNENYSAGKNQGFEHDISFAKQDSGNNDHGKSFAVRRGRSIERSSYEKRLQQSGIRSDSFTHKDHHYEERRERRYDDRRVEDQRALGNKRGTRYNSQDTQKPKSTGRVWGPDGIKDLQ